MQKLLYCYDALCGWCYGFSAVINEFAANHPDLPVEVVSGGMITGARIGPIGEVAGYIGEAYKTVEKSTGVTFGDGFLQGILAEGSAVFTSVPAGVAMAIYREARPDRQLAYATALKRAIYYDGILPTDAGAYADRAATLGADRDDFLAKMDDPAYLQLAEADFTRCSRFGVTGFPTLVVDDGTGKLYALARGYLPLDRLEANFRQLPTAQ